MKSLNESELDSLVADAQQLLGSCLQEVLCFDRDLALGHWAGSKLKWLWLDLNPMSPSFWVLDRLPQSTGASRKQPIQLFLRAHGRGRQLTEIRRVVEWGRVLTFAYGESLTLEFRAIPRAVNLLVRSPEGKAVSWAKVKPLTAQADRGSGVFTETWSEESSVPVSAEALKQRWLNWRWAQKSSQEGEANQRSSEQKIKKQLEKLIQKKEKALTQVEQACLTQSDSSWRELGQWLLQNQQFSFARKQDLSTKLQSLLEEDKGLAWNIDHCFTKAKTLEAKLGGSQERRDILVKELEELKAVFAAVSEGQEGQGQLSNRELQQAIAKLKPASLSQKGIKRGTKRPLQRSAGQRRLRCRKLAWEDGQEFFVGLSGQDNLELLRQARPWDLWFHLKDQPGAHGILRRERKQQVSDERIKEAGLFLLSTQKGVEVEEGAKWSLVMAERRFVQPIKGDRLGRVQFHNERSIFLKT